MVITFSRLRAWARVFWYLRASRSLVTTSRWWRTGLEMLLLGILVAGAAFAAGAIVAAVIAR